LITDIIFDLLFATELSKQNDLMRFFKGSKVEVLQEAEVPFGSWRPGEIVSGNGHTYLVRYNESPVDSGVAVERVPRRLMRPCPPADDLVCWDVGSILEAFDSYSWKVAEVVSVLGKKHYLVRLLGSSLELKTHASDLRSRKLWLDDKWIVTQKVMLLFHQFSNRLFPLLLVSIRSMEQFTWSVVCPMNYYDSDVL
jgi:hypothetical protein